jgi:hypothetical protein
MRKELEQKLVERWPSWFNVNGSTYETRMSDGFAHGDGWFDIVWKLCEDLEPLLVAAEAGQPFEVLQVKQKFGSLRFYVSHRHRTDAILQRIQAAEVESLHTCEECGKPGTLRTIGWIRTMCDEHASL